MHFAPDSRKQAHEVSEPTVSPVDARFSARHAHRPLCGRWLRDAGFVVGAKVRVHVEPGRLVLEVEPDAEPHTRAAPYQSVER